MERHLGAMRQLAPRRLAAIPLLFVPGTTGLAQQTTGVAGSPSATTTIGRAAVTASHLLIGTGNIGWRNPMPTIENKTFDELRPGDAALVQRTLQSGDVPAWAAACWRGSTDDGSFRHLSYGAAGEEHQVNELLRPQ